MRSTRSGCAHPLEELCAEVDRLWTTLVAAPPLHGWGQTPRAGFPAVNLRETDDAFIVEAELPGLAPADVDVSVVGDDVVLAGRRGPAADAVADGATDIVWHRRERGHGAFERRISLPVAVNPDGVEARLSDGVLTVRCPKAPECQPHKVPVRAG